MPRSNFTLFSASPRLLQWMSLRSRRRNWTSQPQLCLLPIRVCSPHLTMELSVGARILQLAQRMHPQTGRARVPSWAVAPVLP